MILRHNPTVGFFMDQFYDTYSKFVYKEAWLYCKSIDETDDLTQEVWVKLCEKESLLSNLSPKQHFVYLSTTVRNTAISLSRKQKETLPLEFAEQYGYNEPEILNEALDRKLSVEQFRMAWPQIPQPAREILERKYILLESDQEIAETMRIAPNSVRMYLTRARKIALSFLKKENEQKI